MLTAASEGTRRKFCRSANLPHPLRRELLPKEGAEACYFKFDVVYTLNPHGSFFGKELARLGRD